MQPLVLGVVDQSPVRKGGSGGDALRETLALAERAESLGYARYWVAEHHGMPSIASTSPEILVGQIAARTRAIRVGSGGVMLSHYSALKVAENFRMLESLFPGRIDLGLGRAPGGDQRAAAALAYPGQIRDVRFYPEQVDDLVAFLADDLDASHPFFGVHAGPSSGGMPELWLLGSGIDSAHLAAERGLAFSYAHFFGAAPGHGPAISESYRRRFRPQHFLAAPRVHVAVFAVCAETQAEAQRLAASLRLSRVQLARGTTSGIPSPEEALAVQLTPEEEAFVARSQMPAVVGAPDQVRAELEAAAQAYGAQELGIVTITYDFAARVRSYELIAREFGLSGRA